MKPTMITLMACENLAVAKHAKEKWNSVNDALKDDCASELRLWKFAALSQAVQQQVESATSSTLLTAGRTVVQVQDTVAAKLEALELQADTIKEELAKSGNVVRRKARDAGAAVADAAVEA